MQALSASFSFLLQNARSRMFPKRTFQLFSRALNFYLLWVITLSHIPNIFEYHTSAFFLYCIFPNNQIIPVCLRFEKHLLGSILLSLSDWLEMFVLCPHFPVSHRKTILNVFMNALFEFCFSYFFTLLFILNSPHSHPMTDTPNF